MDNPDTSEFTRGGFKDAKFGTFTFASDERKFPPIGFLHRYPRQDAPFIGVSKMETPLQWSVIAPAGRA